MNKIETDIANAIMKEMSLKNPLWKKYWYKIIASSSHNSSYSIDHMELLNSELNLNKKFVTLGDYDDAKQNLFKNLNLKERINVVEFYIEDNRPVEIKTYWLQSEQDEFELYLPKSKKGKIKAWYSPTDESQTEIINTDVQLPKKDVQFDTSNLNIDKSFFELNKIVFYPNNNLWDGGFYSLSNIDNNWTGTSALYLFDSVEDKNSHQATQVDYELILNDKIKTLFDFIVTHYKNENPAVPFDSIFVTVQNDGQYVVNFEFEGEEVSPAAPLIPETITAEYLFENLFNCLIDNAPDNFLWAWENIKREKVTGGSNNIEGTFYFSVNADKSNPQKIVPGEYNFMFNVTEQLFDNFIDNELKNWAEVKLIFSKTGQCEYEVLKRN